MNLAEEEISYVVSRFLLGHTLSFHHLPAYLSVHSWLPTCLCSRPKNPKELGPPWVLKTAALDPRTALITMGGH